ncbi:hypothetical protein BU14_3065s0001, partial [Porphyra umbilicalis]
QRQQAGSRWLLCGGRSAGRPGLTRWPLFCAVLWCSPRWRARTCGAGSPSLPRPSWCACAVRRLPPARCRGLKQITDVGAIEAMVAAVLAENSKEVELYRGGKNKLFGFFVGKVLAASGGRADPQLTNDIVKRLLAA